MKMSPLREASEAAQPHGLPGFGRKGQQEPQAAARKEAQAEARAEP
jgi:hypothetical protein